MEGGEKLRPSITTHLARPRAIASGLAPVPKTKEGDTGEPANFGTGAGTGGP